MACINNNFWVCDAKKSDVDAIDDILRSSLPDPLSKAMVVNELLSPLSRNLLLKVKETDSGEIIAGYLNYWVIVDEVHIQNLAVRKDMRRQGIASCLMSEMLVRTREEGVRRTTLEVRPSNNAALALYEKMGFKKAGVRRGYYADTKEDALILWAEMD
ncbi:MAG: ribosomal protein S18-alanine N-acetyltransferase [Smithellaceae bacterium]|nr:ribosomal protein S18-alanine N-acetyltransferase [Smithellaceae bacterium]